MPITPSILPEEKELFTRVAGGDEAAFAKIFYYYLSRIHPFIRKMTRSEEIAEDIVQDVFVSLWKNRANLATIDNHASYIFTMATNKTYNYLKAKAREVKGLKGVMLQEDDVTNNTQELLDLHATQSLINELVEGLPPQKKLIYKLTREEGLSHEEIAERLNLSKNTVKNHLIEALKILREGLKKSPGASLLLISVFIKIHE